MNGRSEKDQGNGVLNESDITRYLETCSEQGNEDVDLENWLKTFEHVMDGLVSKIKNGE